MLCVMHSWEASVRQSFWVMAFVPCFPLMSTLAKYHTSIIFISFFVFLERSPFKLIFQFYLNFLWFWRLLNILQLGFSFAERKFTSRHLYNFISYFNIWIQMQCDSIRTKYKPRLASLSNYHRAYKILMASVTIAITSLLITSLIDYLYLICFTSLS